MFRRILTPRPSPPPDPPAQPNSPQSPTAPAAVYRRDPPPAAPSPTISAPLDFHQLAHVECDPNTGLYTGMDHFLTLAVSSKGRRRSSLDSSALRAASFDTSAAVAAALPPAATPSPPRRRGAGRDAPGARAGEDDDDAVAEIQAQAAAAAASSRAVGGAPQAVAPTAGKPPKGPGQGVGSPTKRRSPRRLGGGASSRSLFAKPSMPTEVTHAVHVRVDPSHPTGFAGLPSAWETILLYSGIDRDEALLHPQEVVDVLNFSKAQETPGGGGGAVGEEAKGRGEDLEQQEHFPQIKFTFPRTPTVTSFDDASDFSVGPNPPSVAGTPPPRAARNSLARQVPDLVLAPVSPSSPPAGEGDGEDDRATPRLSPHAKGIAGAVLETAGRSVASASMRVSPPAKNTEHGDNNGGRLLARSMTNVDFSRGGKGGAGLTRKHSLRLVAGGGGKGGGTQEKENRPLAKPLRPRSRSTVGGLAALASRVGIESPAKGGRDSTDGQGGAAAGGQASRTEEDMRNIIGAERVAQLPDCVPADASALDIRTAELHALFSSITKIGEGSSGSVFSAVRRSDAAEVALKQVKPANERDWTLYRYEVHVMKSHTEQENLVKCHDAFREGEYLFMVLELMTESLADVLERRRAGAFNRALASESCPSQDLAPPPPEDGASRIGARKKSRSSGLAMATGFEEGFIAFVCREVLQGLGEVHRISRVHRDIKSDNILVRAADGAVKVADFGFCAELTAGARNTVVGTPYQMAPEVIRGKDYGTAVDIWSTGVLAYELAEGVPPHEGLAPIRAMFKIATSDPPALGEVWSPELREFVAICCRKQPELRPSAEQALQHPFLDRACSREEAAEVMFGETPLF